MYIARQSQNIESDIQRNWSSWNFGEDGFEGTFDELQQYLLSSTDDMPAEISMIEIYPRDIKRFQFGELYDNYWVVIDNINASGGLSCINLEACNLEDAIEEAKMATYCCDGDCFDASEAILVYSSDDIHIFQIED